MTQLRFKSLIVSLFTTSLDAGLFALCTLIWAGGTTLLTARWFCGAVGAVANFLLNRAWAFGQKRCGLWRQGCRYAATALAAVTLATILWAVLCALTAADPRLMHLVSLSLVWLAFTFPMLRRFVFKAPLPSSQRR